MVFLTLVIGLVNLALGFVLAVKLGYGPPTLLDAWDALASGGASPAGGVHFDDVDVTGELNAMLGGDANGNIEALLDDSSLDDLFDEPFDDEEDGLRASEEVVTEEAEADGPEVWNLDEKYVETSILKLNIAMMKSGARATSLDTRLRECAGKTDQETIEACLKELTEDCETYLVEQSEAADKLHDRLGELGELSQLGEDIEMANMEQAAQIETTLNNLKHMDFSSDLEAANTRLLGELNHLRIARHRLRDSQEEAFLAVARYEGRLGKVAEQLYNDRLTKLFNRIGLEVTLHQWWKVGHHRNRQMTAGILNFDHFEHLNETYGSAVGDKVIVQMAQILREEAGTGDIVARFGGDQFFFMPVDVGPRTAIKKIEVLRQKIERTTFLHDDQPICLTFCAGISEIKPDDLVEALLGRLADALKKAKKEGANHSFTHDGREIHRVESPNFGVDEVEIPL
ncbi:MAG: GGDEF domain-containing protein [Pirellulales bacterium]|nr:GGDEF domain-containing protein [Pirellulales bacterium]